MFLYDTWDCPHRKNQNDFEGNVSATTMNVDRLCEYCGKRVHLSGYVTLNLEVE